MISHYNDLKDHIYIQGMNIGSLNAWHSMTVNTGYNIINCYMQTSIGTVSQYINNIEQYEWHVDGHTCYALTRVSDNVGWNFFAILYKVY